MYAFPTLEDIIISDIKKELLKDNNFKVLFVNNNEPNLEKQDNLIIISRRKINGENLRNNSEEFTHLFDTEYVYDSQNRLINFTR